MRFQFNTMLAIVGTLMFTMALNSLLSFATFEAVRTRALVATYEAVASSLQRTIERSLRLGKPLGAFNNMHAILTDGVHDVPGVLGVVVQGLDGGTLYAVGTPVVKVCQPSVSGMPQTSVDGSLYFTCVPLYGKQRAMVGFLGMSFPRSLITDALGLLAVDNLKVLGGLALGATLVLASLFPPLISLPLRARLMSLSGVLRDGKPELPLPHITSPELESISTTIHGISCAASQLPLPSDVLRDVAILSRSIGRNGPDMDTRVQALVDLVNGGEKHGATA